MSFEGKYAAKRSRADSSYLQITLGVCAASLAGIAIAVIKSVLWGTVLCLLSALVYKAFASDDIEKQLGIRYKSVCGHISIKSAVGVIDGKAVSPSRLVWSTVSSIEDGAFSSDGNHDLLCIYIPNTVKSIGECPFGNLAIRPSIYYEGTPDDWKKINGSKAFKDCSVIFNCPQPDANTKTK